MFAVIGSKPMVCIFLHHTSSILTRQHLIVPSGGGGGSRMKLYTVYLQEFILYIWRVAWNIQHTYLRVIIGKEGWGNKNDVWPKSTSFFVAQMILCYGQLIICPKCNSSVYVYQKSQLTVFYTNLEFYGWCWTREI